jgi:hypothetical protein
MPELNTCPACNGEPNRPSVYFATVRRPDGSLGSESGVKVFGCALCDSTGSVTAEVEARYRRGRAMREARIEEGKSLREKAAEIGVSPSFLSRAEQGLEELPGGDGA